MRTAIVGLLALTASLALAPTPAPAQETFETGEAPWEPTYTHMGTFKTSAYSLRGIMRGGRYTYDGAVAVDPRVIPLGSLLYIDGLGYFSAEDTGGVVLGKHVDIWMPSYRQAILYGIQYRDVWLVQ